VVQETWLAVLKGIDRFEGRSSLRTWLFTILAHSAQRRAVRERRTIPFAALGTDEDPDAGSFLPDTHPRWPNAWATTVDSWESVPEARLESRETLGVAGEAIRGLPPTQRAVISLRDVQGMDAAEVCEVLAITEANQRVLLHRARTRVRRALEVHLDPAA
jgi:RNA polymerase sigma-70 factor (ECF subfamily)